MRNSFAIFPLILAAGLAWPALAEEQAAPPAADQAQPTEPAKPEQTREQRLDSLFGQLKRERNEKAAERIAGQIWEEWFQSGSASIDLMMQWAQHAMEQQKYDVALDFLDEVITLQPNYAEGWNRRATVNFMMSNYSKSMSDIDHTLALEPRHFGALSGMAQILKNTGKKELALKAYQRVLDIYPMMRSAQNEVSTLSEELAGEGI
jgi:tetratricopeptide (TPR) repeat protein